MDPAVTLELPSGLRAIRRAENSTWNKAHIDDAGAGPLAKGETAPDTIVLCGEERDAGRARLCEETWLHAPWRGASPTGDRSGQQLRAPVERERWKLPIVELRTPCPGPVNDSATSGAQPSAPSGQPHPHLND